MTARCVRRRSHVKPRVPPRGGPGVSRGVPPLRGGQPWRSVATAGPTATRPSPGSSGVVRPAPVAPRGPGGRPPPGSGSACPGSAGAAPRKRARVRHVQTPPRGVPGSRFGRAPRSGFLACRGDLPVMTPRANGDTPRAAGVLRGRPAPGRLSRAPQARWSFVPERAGLASRPGLPSTFRERLGFPRVGRRAPTERRRVLSAQTSPRGMSERRRWRAPRSCLSTWQGDLSVITPRANRGRPMRNRWFFAGDQAPAGSPARHQRVRIAQRSVSGSRPDRRCSNAPAALLAVRRRRQHRTALGGSTRAHPTGTHRAVRATDRGLPRGPEAGREKGASR